MKKTLKIIGWTLFSLLMVILLAFGIACYILFTPSRLTPIVNRIVGNYVTCEYEIGRVELTFFSTFPCLGVRIDGLTLVNPVEGAQSDTVLHAQYVTAEVDIKQLLFHNNLILTDAVMEETDLNYYVAQDGSSNFDIFVTEPEDTKEVEADSTEEFSLPFDELHIPNGIRIEARRISYLDEQDTIYASLGTSTIMATARSWNDMHLYLSASDVYARLWDEIYADSIHVTFESPIDVHLDSMRFGFDHAHLIWDQFAMKLNGEITLDDSTSLDMRLTTEDKWAIEPLMTTLPHSWVESLEEYDPKGNLSFTAIAQGVISETQMPIVTVPQLRLNVWDSHFDIKGKISDIEADMLFDVNMGTDIYVPDFKPFLPDDLTIKGRAKGPVTAKLRLSDLDNGVFTQGQADLTSDRLLVTMDTTVDAELDVTTIHLDGTQLLADKAAEYHITITGDYVDGKYDDIRADLNEARLDMSLVGGKKIKAKLKADDFNGRMGDETTGVANALTVEAAARYNKNEENLLLRWSPKINIQLKDGEFKAPDQLPDILYVPSINFKYSNREMTINDSRIEIGNSDLELKGDVRHIGRWLRHKGILEGELDITSNHCDANQLLTWISDDKGSEEEEEEETSEPAVETESSVTKDSVATESKPFLVPKDIDFALKTNLKEVVYSGEIARELHGGIYLNKGIMVLDEVGFICRAAKLQLSAMYRTPRHNHLYLGFDYHMVDVDLDELRSLIPFVDESMPMLRSFGGDAQFHLAAETYLNSQYKPKMSTLRGASSLTGTNLIIRDSKEFNEIARLLVLKKKPENYIDSLNAEITIYKRDIDVYPLCVSINNYMIALGGRHTTNQTFDYDINVLKPVYLGVKVSGTADDLQIKLAKCKFAEDFRPHWYQKADTMSLELRQRIKQSMERNVHIQSDKSQTNTNK